LKPGAALPADGRHLDNAPVLVKRHDRDDTTVREEYIIKYAVRIEENSSALARNKLELRHQPLEIASGKREQQTIAGPF